MHLAGVQSTQGQLLEGESGHLSFSVDSRPVVRHSCKVVAKVEHVTPAEALEVMSGHLARLRAFMERFDRQALATRPPNGDWSAIENFRHALHAEQHHLGRYVPGGLGSSLLALPQGKQAPVPANDPRNDVQTVFDEWERIRAAVYERLDLSLPGLEWQLPRLMRHQQQHARMAARALSHATGETVRIPSKSSR
jgi:hypothetical protein